VGPVPRLGPRVWHLYLLLEQPATATELSKVTSLTRDTVADHLRTLEEHGLASPSRSTSDDRVWERTPGLSQDLEAHADRVLRRRNASRNPLRGPGVADGLSRLQGKGGMTRPSTPFERAAFAVFVVAMLLAVVLLAFF
jgi:predicted transcriptional regulator